MTILKTIQEYAIENGKSHQSVYQNKTNPPVDCPVYAMYNGEYVHVGYQKFIVVKNNVTGNQQVKK